MGARWGVRFVGAMIVVVGLAGIIAAVVEQGSRRDHPDEWIPAVRSLVAFVEVERGLAFEHPVRIDFLSEASYRTELTADLEELAGSRDRTLLSARLLGAVGLLERPLDIIEDSTALFVGGTAGTYLFDEQRIRLRGSELTPLVAAVLVHELTHALQDQHFDIGQRYEDLEDDPEEASAFAALVEGDATRVQSAYERGLSRADRTLLGSERAEMAADLERRGAASAPILQTFAFAPYALGEAMLDLAVAVNGSQGIDALFTDPPVTEEHLLDPWTLIEDDDRAKPVSEPPIRSGEREIGRDSLGALGWYLILADRLDPRVALTAVDGWGGSAFAVFERDGVDCVRIRYQGDTSGAMNEMHRALARWIDGGAGATASVQVVGSELEFESCAPGPGAHDSSGSSNRAVALALARTKAATHHYRLNGDPARARCVAEALVRQHTAEQLLDPRFRDDAATTVIATCP